MNCIYVYIYKKKNEELKEKTTLKWRARAYKSE